MESKQLQQIAESWFDAELDKTIFQESKEAALYYKEQYLATYRAGFREGQKQAQPGAVWTPASTKPEHNVGVLVFIPGEDNHVTSGMWDISNQWVLLDEYRTPEEEVTHWMPLPAFPEGYKHDVISDEWVSTLKAIAKEELAKKESAAGREEDKAHFDNWHRWLSDNGYTYDGEYYYDEDNNYFTPDQLWVKFN